jgi:hypothetical protein
MAIQFLKLFQPLQLANASALIFTVGASPATNILRNGRVRLVNSTAGAVAATLYSVPAGGSAGVTNIFLSAQSIGPGATIEVDIPTLSAGDALYGFAGAATSITMHAMDGVLYS